LEGVEIVCRRRPHVGEEDSEEEMERKVQKKEDTNEEKMFLTTRPRNVKKINLTSEVKTQNKYDLCQTMRIPILWSVGWMKARWKRSPRLKN
jgi:hypothetical protein